RSKSGETCACSNSSSRRDLNRRSMTISSVLTSVTEENVTKKVKSRQARETVEVGEPSTAHGKTGGYITLGLGRRLITRRIVLSIAPLPSGTPRYRKQLYRSRPASE